MQELLSSELLYFSVLFSIAFRSNVIFSISKAGVNTTANPHCLYFRDNGQCQVLVLRFRNRYPRFTHPSRELARWLGYRSRRCHGDGRVAATPVLLPVGAAANHVNTPIAASASVAEVMFA